MGLFSKKSKELPVPQRVRDLEDNKIRVSLHEMITIRRPDRMGNHVRMTIEEARVVYRELGEKIAEYGTK